MSQPPNGNASACADVDVWRPRPVDWFTPPVARAASGIKALTKVDFPTPGAQRKPTPDRAGAQ